MHRSFFRAALALALPAAFAASPVQAQPASLSLSSFDGSIGFTLNGQAGGDNAAAAVSAGGDINGDGIADIVIGAPQADPRGLNSAGRSYVVFGRSAGFASPLELGSLNGNDGFLILGEAADDLSGSAVSAAGDVNGDGLDDLIIGASGAGPGNVGRSYVVFGRSSGFAATLPLESLNGANGFIIEGEFAGDASGVAVSGGRDINDDGIDDLLITAQNADPNGDNSGRAYVVFGRNSGFPAVLPLSSLNSTNGFAMDGEGQGNFFGRAASMLGDINDDGIDDLIVGANNASQPGVGGRPGRGYVVFGSTAAFVSPLQISSLDGSNGFFLNGQFSGDQVGIAVSQAGDVNGDGIADLIIGASGADPNGERSGRGYVVFGTRSGFPQNLNLASLDGSNGFAVNGEAAFDSLGGAVSGAGDINGDGVDDMVFGAIGANPAGAQSGRAYLVFGRRAGFAALLETSELDGLQGAGFALDGERGSDSAGTSVSAAGDLNVDGVDDLILGAPNADRGGTRAGRGYVLFGTRDPAIFSNGFEQDVRR